MHDRMVRVAMANVPTLLVLLMLTFALNIVAILIRARVRKNLRALG